MNKLTEIAKAWIAAANPSEDQKAIAEYRTSVCDSCEKKGYNNMLDIYYCMECGCPLSKKVFSPNPGPKACPLAKWEK